MEKVVTYPDHVLAGIGKNHRAHPLPSNLRLFGADTETVHGSPHTLQIWDGPRSGEPVALFYVTKRTIFPVMWAYVRPRMAGSGVNVCYFHNFHFDAMIIFADHHLDIYEQGGSTEFFLEVDGSKLKKKLSEEPDRVVLRVEILFGKVNAATVTEGVHYMEDGALRFKSQAELKIYDSRAFTQAGLDRSLKMFKIPYQKLEADKEWFSKGSTSKEFEAYAKQDAVAEWHLARRIMDIHDKYQVRPSISLPQFMSRVFRHDFFSPKDNIPFPPEHISRAAELSYHGGKNGMYCVPGVYEDVTEVDINSAYPWAMRELPSFLEGRYRSIDAFDPGLAGIYKVSGWTDPKAVYPLIFDHAFRRVDGSFADLWVTGYEMERILKAPFIRIDRVTGYVWVPRREGMRNPFRDFVDHFYKLKQDSPRDDPYYNFYKIALNALYGKLVGVVEERDMLFLDEEENAARSTGKTVKLDYRYDAALGRYVKAAVKNVAGQMYNPFIATLITGRVRALLYDLETKYEAIHSATDSIKTRKPVKEFPGLGGWKEEVSGRCWIFRNKLYLHFSNKNPVDHAFKKGAADKEECAICKKGKRKHIRDRGQSLEKYGLHAYKGSVEDLFENRAALLRDGEMEYQFQHVVGLREGLRGKKRETPGDFVTRTEKLRLKGRTS